MNNKIKDILTLILALMLAIIISACGVENNNEDNNDTTETTQTTQSVTPSGRQLPAFENGVVKVDGDTRGSLTQLSAERFAGSGINVEIGSSGANNSFKAFCEGKIDIVDSSRPISRREYALCLRNGISPVQFQAAAEAVVVAIRSETDVGTDCLTVKQVKEMYRAGSPIFNWNQLGYDSVPLKVAGPDADNNAFSFFGQTVLGSPEPTIQDFRSDYVAQETDRGVREYLVGSTADVVRASRLEGRLQLNKYYQEQLDKAKTSKSQAWQELKEAALQVRKGKRDKRSKAQQSKDKARLEKAKRAYANAREYEKTTRRQIASNNEKAKIDRAAAERIAKLRGRVGYFRFSYYELFEEQLRPMEISITEGANRNCIFPSQDTVTSAAYPLARQLLLTVSTRSLNRGEVKNFLVDYMNNTRQLSSNQRLVPLPEAVIERQLAWLNGSERPDIVDYPEVTLEDNTQNTNTVPE